MSMHAIEDAGTESDTATLVVSEYWPTAAADNGRASEPRLGVPNSGGQAGPSWWEKSNWFRVQEPRDQAARRDEAQRAMGMKTVTVTATLPVGQPSIVTKPYSHPLHDDDDAPVPYGGLDEDGAQLGTRYTGKANKGIGATAVNAVRNSTAERLAAAPGGAEVFCRFNSTPSSTQTVAYTQATSAAATASVVPPVVVAPVGASSPAPSLLSRGGSGSTTLSSPAVKTKVAARPRVKLQSLQGYDAAVKKQVHELVVLPLLHPQIFSALGVKPSRGVLLSGASGGGKTSLVRTLVEELGASCYFQHADAAHLLTELQADLASQKASNPKNLETSIGVQNSGGGLGAPKEEGQCRCLQSSKLADSN
jgi:hypothetical protein